MARSTRPHGLRTSRSSADEDDERHRGDQREIGEVEGERIALRAPAKGRGMKPMPKGPPVRPSALSATSWMAIAMPKVVMAR